MIHEIMTMRSHLETNKMRIALENLDTWLALVNCFLFNMRCTLAQSSASLPVHKQWRLKIPKDSLVIVASIRLNIQSRRLIYRQAALTQGKCRQDFPVPRNENKLSSSINGTPGH